MLYKNIKILYEDKELIVLDKPSGLTVHPGAGQKNYTLVDFLIKKYGKNLSNLSGNHLPHLHPLHNFYICFTAKTLL